MFGLGNTTNVSVDIDTPSPNAILSGSVAINGWAIGGSAPISSVTLSLDGSVIGQASYGSSRPDVQSAYPGNPGGASVGWTGILNTNGLASGSHTLTATAVDGTGISNSTTQNFVVANVGASTTTLFPSLPSGTPTPITTTTNAGVPIAITSSSPSIRPLLLIGGGALILFVFLGGSNK